MLIPIGHLSGLQYLGMKILGRLKSVVTIEAMKEGRLYNRGKEECMFQEVFCAASRAHFLVSYGISGSPSEELARSNCLIVHPSDFQQGQHVVVKQAFPMTTR